jgi:hypothetical protein
MPVAFDAPAIVPSRKASTGRYLGKIRLVEQQTDVAGQGCVDLCNMHAMVLSVVVCNVLRQMLLQASKVGIVIVML